MTGLQHTAQIPRHHPAGLTRRAIRYCLLVFIGARIALSLVGLGVGALSFNEPPDWMDDAPLPTSGLHNLWDATNRLDAAWFQTIADEGYQDERSAAFFPLYPLAIRAVSWLPGLGTLGAAILVSNVSLLAALIVLYRLTALEMSEDIARRAVIILMAFPTSFFLLAPYSESLYLLLTLLAFSSLRRGRFVGASVAGAASAATRLIGVALIPAIIVESLSRQRGGARRARLTASLIVGLGPLLYLLWWALHAGDFWAPIHAQEAWRREFAFPLETLGRALAQAVGGLDQPDGGYWISDAGIAGIVIAALITVWRRVAPSYAAFAAVSLLVPLSYPYLGRDLFSMSRFVIVVFPAFWGMALWTTRRGVLAGWLVVSVPLAAWHALLFMHWRHIY